MTLAALIASANSPSLIITVTISRKMIMVKVPCLSSQEAIKIECHNLVKKKLQGDVIIAAMAASARSIWEGSISFGLVNIPVQVFSATQKEEFTSFNQLDDKGHRIKYKKWCPIEEREVPYSELKKGYQISKDNYAVIEKEDLDKIKLKKTKSIDVKEFIDSKDFDPLLIEKSYYVAPEKNKKTGAIDKAYTLFARVINETNKIAIGKVV